MFGLRDDLGCTIERTDKSAKIDTPKKTCARGLRLEQSNSAALSYNLHRSVQVRKPARREAWKTFHGHETVGPIASPGHIFQQRTVGQKPLLIHDACDNNLVWIGDFGQIGQ